MTKNTIMTEATDKIPVAATNLDKRILDALRTEIADAVRELTEKGAILSPAILKGNALRIFEVAKFAEEIMHVGNPANGVTIEPTTETVAVARPEIAKRDARVRDLRDVKKLTWSAVAKAMKLSVATCRTSYRRAQVTA